MKHRGTSTARKPVAAGYSGTPLPKKLGIKPGMTIGLVNAPRDFMNTLASVPPNVKFETGCAPGGLNLWFLTSASELNQNIRKMSKAIGDGRLWMIWPKQASGVKTDVTQKLVREVALAHHLVDYKVCAVDHIWSGLLFKRRD